VTIEETINHCKEKSFEQWVNGTLYRFTQDQEGRFKITKIKDLLDLFDEGRKRGTESEKTDVPRPLPCVRDEDGEMFARPIDDFIAKIDEEYNELKEAIILLGYTRGTALNHPSMIEKSARFRYLIERVAEEAADTITAITTMLEALGIGAEMRDEAQRRVNDKNRERGRL
jgi:hypothetical protein